MEMKDVLRRLQLGNSVAENDTELERYFVETETFQRLSEARVEDTLLAESGEYAQYIEKFRDGKAEHNGDSLVRTLNLPADEARAVTKVLMDMGFLEQIGEAYKIPMLYRDGLKITQGKAFQTEELKLPLPVAEAEKGHD
jgi:hypothetical protein